MNIFLRKTLKRNTNFKLPYLDLKPTISKWRFHTLYISLFLVKCMVWYYQGVHCSKCDCTSIDQALIGNVRPLVHPCGVATLIRLIFNIFGARHTLRFNILESICPIGSPIVAYISLLTTPHAAQSDHRSPKLHSHSQNKLCALIYRDRHLNKYHYFRCLHLTSKINDSDSRQESLHTAMADRP